MICRWNCPLLLLATFTFAMTLAAPNRARADAMATFRIENDSGGPISRADFQIIPVGSVKAPVVGSNPVTGQNQTSSPLSLFTNDSDGFDPTNLQVALGSNSQVEGLRLLFGEKQIVGAGGQVSFQPVVGANGTSQFWSNGGDVAFSLALDPAFQGSVKLISLTKGVHVYAYTPQGDGGGSGGDGGSSGETPNVPEPISLMIWSTVAGLGWARTRRHRRAA